MAGRRKATTAAAKRGKQPRGKKTRSTKTRETQTRRAKTLLAATRRATIRRTSKETDIRLTVGLEGTGRVSAETGIGFFDHMLSALALHGGLDLDLKARGDLHVDQHHLVEDCGITLGQALRDALGDRKGIERTGFFAFPMEESLALAAVDLGGRPSLVFKAKFRRVRVGDLETDTIAEFLRGLTRGLGADLHVTLPYGWNDHHKTEALFKAVGKALKMAVNRDGRYSGVMPSTKGMLE